MIRNTFPNKGKTECFHFKDHLLAIVSVVFCVALCGCGSATVSSRHEIGVATTGKPTMVYVSDFDLDSSKVKSESGILPPPPKLPGLLGNILPPPPGTPKDPAILARDLVELMST